jgi:hypothetical protein
LTQGDDILCQQTEATTTDEIKKLQGIAKENKNEVHAHVDVVTA